jgi:hypothetical protein
LLALRPYCAPPPAYGQTHDHATWIGDLYTCAAIATPCCAAMPTGAVGICTANCPPGATPSGTCTCIICPAGPATGPVAGLEPNRARDHDAGFIGGERRLLHGNCHELRLRRHGCCCWRRVVNRRHARRINPLAVLDPDQADEAKRDEEWHEMEWESVLRGLAHGCFRRALDRPVSSQRIHASDKAVGAG